MVLPIVALPYNGNSSKFIAEIQLKLKQKGNKFAYSLSKQENLKKVLKEGVDSESKIMPGIPSMELVDHPLVLVYDCSQLVLHGGEYIFRNPGFKKEALVGIVVVERVN